MGWPKFPVRGDDAMIGDTSVFDNLRGYGSYVVVEAKHFQHPHPKSNVPSKERTYNKVQPSPTLTPLASLDSASIGGLLAAAAVQLSAALHSSPSPANHVVSTAALPGDAADAYDAILDVCVPGGGNGSGMDGRNSETVPGSSAQKLKRD